MDAKNSTPELIQALQQIQEKYEALANEYSKLQEKIGATAPDPVTSLAENAILPSPARHSADEVRRHVEATQNWRRKNPWAIFMALVYARKIRRLNLFDFKWYQERAQVNGETIRHPFRHFIRCGLFEGRDPSPGFDTRHYLERHLSRLEPAEPAIFHYIRAGRKAGLPCNARQMSHDEYLQASLKIISAETAKTLRLVQVELARHIDEKIDHAQHHITKNMEKPIVAAREKLEREIRRLIQNEIKQLQGLISLQSYMSGNNPLMEYRGWPISPDIGLFLIDQISQNHYDLIIEFGSGTSTLLMAKALQKLHAVEPGRTTKIISFEHLSAYRKRTQQMLSLEGLAEYATVVEAALVPLNSFNGMIFQYYDCAPQLASLAQRLIHHPHIKIFALVDGPPQATNPKARLPALEVLSKYFPQADIDLLMDDYNRDDEKAAVLAWQDFCKNHSRASQIRIVNAEKGAALMTTTYIN